MIKGISVTLRCALLLFIITAGCFQQIAAQTLFAANTVLANYSISGGKMQLLPATKVMSPLTIGTDYLVSHNEINQKLSEGYFLKKSGVTVPADDLCITVDEAKTWLYLEESLLPTNGRMPLWQELVPLIPSVTVSFTLAPSSAPGPMLMEVRFSNVTLAPISFKWGYCVYNTTIPVQSCYGFSGASNGGTPTQTTIPTGTMGYTQNSSSNTIGANYGYIVKIVIYDIQGIPASKIQLAAGQNYSLVFM